MLQIWTFFVMNFYEHNFSNLNVHRKCLFTKLHQKKKKKLREKRKFHSSFSSQIFFLLFKTFHLKIVCRRWKHLHTKIQLIMSFTFFVLKLKIFLVRLCTNKVHNTWGKLPEKVFFYTRENFFITCFKLKAKTFLHASVCLWIKYLLNEIDFLVVQQIGDIPWAQSTHAHCFIHKNLWLCFLLFFFLSPIVTQCRKLYLYADFLAIVFVVFLFSRFIL